MLQHPLFPSCAHVYTNNNFLFDDLSTFMCYPRESFFFLHCSLCILSFPFLFFSLLSKHTQSSLHLAGRSRQNLLHNITSEILFQPNNIKQNHKTTKTMRSFNPVRVLSEATAGWRWGGGRGIPPLHPPAHSGSSE